MRKKTEQLSETLVGKGKDSISLISYNTEKKYIRTYFPSPRSRKKNQGFPGGAVVKNPPAKAGDMGLNPGPGRSHMPRSN